ncbi:MAG: exo-alpha-sialidase [Saprospiraceae bacterium]
MIKNFMVTFYRILFFLMPIALVAQDSSVGISERPESETTLAVNPNNVNQLVAAAVNDFSPLPGTDNSRISIYYSNNGGLNWKQSDYNGAIENSTNINFIGDPVLSYAMDGTVYLTYLVWDFLSAGFEARLILANSTDNGENWTTQVVNTLTEGVFDKPWLTIDNSSDSPFQNRVYLSYIYSTENEYQIEVIRKDQNETPTVATVAVDKNEFRVVQSPSIVTNREGDIFVSFVTNQPGSTALHVVKSTDGGESFSAPKQVTNLRMYYNDFSVINPIDKTGLRRLYPCPHLGIDNSNGAFSNRIYLTWTDKELNSFDYGLDVFLTFSDDDGETWSTPQVVNNDNEPRIHQYYSTLAVNPQGEVVMCWYDRREDDNNRLTHYYFARSKDGGQTFDEQLPLSSRPSDFSKIGQRNSDFGIGEYTQVIATENQAYAVWADGRENNGNINLYNAKVQLNEPTATVEQQPLQTTFQLELLHPNPAQVLTNAVFSLKIPTELSLKIYNADGKLMHQELTKKYSVGKHQLPINLPHLPSGTYYVHFITNQFEIIRPLLIAHS